MHGRLDPTPPAICAKVAARDTPAACKRRAGPSIAAAATPLASTRADFTCRPLLRDLASGDLIAPHHRGSAFACAQPPLTFLLVESPGFSDQACCARGQGFCAGRARPAVIGRPVPALDSARSRQILEPREDAR